MSQETVSIEVSPALVATFPEFVWQTRLGDYLSSIEHTNNIELDRGFASGYADDLRTYLQANISTVFVEKEGCYTADWNHTIDFSNLNEGVSLSVKTEGTEITISAPTGFTIEGVASAQIIPYDRVTFIRERANPTNLKKVRANEVLYFEGGGINANNTQGWTRRFNGMTMNNLTGMMFGTGVLIESIELTDRNTNTGKVMEIRHYDSAGGDEVIVYTGNVTQEGNRFLYENNLSLYIPPLRRLAIFLTGASFNNPQYRLGYRRTD